MVCRPASENNSTNLYNRTKKGKPVIGEWELSASAPDMRYLDCPDFSLTTNLCAVSDKVNQTRWLIYQQKDKTVVVYDAVKKTRK